MKYNEFGTRLAYLRRKNGLDYEALLEKIGMKKVTSNDLRNWERGLSHPDTDVIKRLSEIYEEPYEELLTLHEQTIQGGVDDIHLGVIETISKLMGVSMYTVIVLARIMLVLLCIIGVLYFIKSMQLVSSMPEMYKNL